MSTRATYQFIPDNLQFKPAITLYIDHDGYPEGAAEYLCEIQSAEQFIRENEFAAITANHEIHVDTEYRYDIYINSSQELGIKALKREGYGDEATWGEFFDGSIDEFMNIYLDAPKRPWPEHDGCSR